MSERLSAEHVGGCNSACVGDGHFLHADPPDVVRLGENGPWYRPGDMGYELGVALVRAQAERDALAAHLADVEARLAAARAEGTLAERERIDDALALAGFDTDAPGPIRAALHPAPTPPQERTVTT